VLHACTTSDAWSTRRYVGVVSHPVHQVGTVGMQEGGVRRVVIPPPVSYQDKSQEPVPRDFSNRQRLYTTIFNPTRIANGRGVLPSG